MKKAICIVCIIFLAFACLTGCGQKDSISDAELIQTALSVTQGEQEKAAGLYAQRKPQPKHEDFAGDGWGRTNVPSGLDGYLMISQQSKEGFVYEMECFYYFHAGVISGEAYFITPNVAGAEFRNEYDGDAPVQYLFFVMQDGNVTVTTTGSDADLGLGARVFVNGEYTKEEPVYTNAGQFEKYFSGAADDFLKEVLSEEEYGESFRFPAQIGVVEQSRGSLADGTPADCLDVFIPTGGGYSFQMIRAQDGRIYVEFENDEIGFVTNDPDVYEMPQWTEWE